MKKEKTILLGGLILVLALGIYVVTWAALDVGTDLNMTPLGKGPFEILKLKIPSAFDSAATWGYVKDAVNGNDPDGTGNVGIWRQNASYDVYLNDGTLPSFALSGNVGIGTNDPSAQLHIYDASGSADIRLQSSSTSDNAWSIYSAVNNNLAFFSHYSTWDSFRNPNIITFAHDGRIGIGTTAPRQHLSIGTYLDIYDGAISGNLEYPSIRSSIENLMINGSHIDGPPDIHGGVYFNYDRGRGVKFFAHPSDTEVLEIASLNDNGDLHLNGTLSVDGSFMGTRKNYVYGKLGVGKMLNPTASLDIIADTGVSDIFRVSHLASGDFDIASLRPNGNVEVSDFNFVGAGVTTHYQAVDEGPSHDGDTSYIVSAQAGQREAKTGLFNVQDLTGDDSIDYVRVRVVCKIDNNPNPVFASPALRVGGTGTTYTNETFTELDENYQTITFTANQNPNGGDWTGGNIDALQIGVQARGGPISPAGPPQYPDSFIAGTQILMADGSYEKIEKIKAGDKVVSYDLGNQLFVDNEVILTTNGNKGYLLINDKLGITLNQKVYIVDKGFVHAKEVKIGDYLLNESKEKIRVNSIKNYSKKVGVYDLVLKSPHNFFAEGYLVHNMPIGGQAQAVAASGVRCTQVYAEVGYFKSEATTALVVDSVGNVGIGTSDPGSYILKTASNGGNDVLVGDDLTVGGTTETDDLHVIDDAQIYGNLFCQSTASIGLSEVPANLSVTGNIFVGDDGTGTCDAGHVGKMRYYTYEEAEYYYSEFQICMQTDTASYSWYTINQEVWGGQSS